MLGTQNENLGRPELTPARTAAGCVESCGRSGSHLMPSGRLSSAADADTATDRVAAAADSQPSVLSAPAALTLFSPLFGSVLDGSAGVEETVPAFTAVTEPSGRGRLPAAPVASPAHTQTERGYAAQHHKKSLPPRLPR